MKLRKVTLENVRSFLDRQELELDGPISILIGPNGGGKTNLLDTIIAVLRINLVRSWIRRMEGNPPRPSIFHNDARNTFELKKHKLGEHLHQTIEVELEVTEVDLANMRAMKTDAVRFNNHLTAYYNNHPRFDAVTEWPDPLPLSSGQRIRYKFVEGQLQEEEKSGRYFRFYLELFEVDRLLREELGETALTPPILTLPISRSGSFVTSVSLPNFDEHNYKQSIDIATSRGGGGGIVEMALGRLATKHRLLREREIWGYMSERHRDTEATLNANDQAALDEFLTELETRDTFILRGGDIEDYLPVEHRSKDIDKLIGFAQDDGFANVMDAASRDELGRILVASIA